MAGSKKINKAKSKDLKAPKVSMYEVIANMDGNPNTPAEFDNSPHDENELFFKADDDATKVDKNKVLILNYIHKDLHQVTERKVPILDTSTDNPNIEIYHRANFNDVELDVCVYWGPRAKGEFKNCFALVKFASDDLSAEHGENGVISTDAAWNDDAKADPFTLKNDKLIANYWAPRWKYVVNALRTTAYDRYEKNGVEKPEPEVPAEADNEATADGAGSQEEKEERMSVFAGSTGKIIGLKGAKINEIRKGTGVKDIKMPAKNEDGPRPKARELVDITIIGKPSQITKAKKMIQEVVDEWANAPRSGRGNDSGYGSGEFNAGGDGGGDNWGPGSGGGAGDLNTAGGGDWENGGASGGGDNSWENGGGGGGETGGGDWAAASAGNGNW